MSVLLSQSTFYYTTIDIFSIFLDEFHPSEDFIPLCVPQLPRCPCLSTALPQLAGFCSPPVDSMSIHRLRPHTERQDAIKLTNMECEERKG